MLSNYLRFVRQLFLLIGVCTTFISNAQNGVGVNTLVPKSSFEDNGSFGKKVSTVSSVTTTLDETYGSVVCITGSTTITLPVATGCAARVYEIKRAVGNAANVTINVTSAGTIDGASSYVLSKAGQSITVFSDGTVWLLRDGSGEGNNWSLTGNAGTVASTNFLGTTDGIDLVFRANNSERIRILGSGATAGNVGIGTTTPRGNTFEVSAPGGDPQIYFSNRANNSIVRDITTNYAFDDGIGASIYARRNTGATFSSAFLRFAVAGNVDRMNVLSTGAEVYQNVFVQGALGTTTQQLRIHNNNIDSYIDYTGGDLTFRDNGAGNALFLEDATGEIGIGTAAPRSILEISGSFGKKVTITAIDLILNGTHSTIVCTNAGVARTLTLPAAAGVTGRIYEIKKDASSTGTITLSGGGNIDGAASLVMTGINTAVTIFSDGTEWKTMQGGSSQNGTAWALLGNAGTASSTNFVGTTDAQDLVFRTNNNDKARISSSGFLTVGFGSVAPKGGRIALMSDGAGRNEEDNIAIYSNNGPDAALATGFDGPSPILRFHVARGTDAAPFNVATNDEVFTIFGRVRYGASLTDDLTCIRSYYKGDRTTALTNLQFWTSGSPNNPATPADMTIDEIGNVGIGTVSPEQNLTVFNGMNIDHGNTNSGSVSNSLRFGSTSGEAIGSKRSNGGANPYGIDFYTNSVNRMVVTNTGNIGIGIAAPLSLLHLYEATGTVPSANAGTLRLEHNNVGGTSSILFKSKQEATDFGFISYSDDGSGTGSSSENSLLTIGVRPDGDFTAEEDDIALMPSGRVGVGTTTPLQKLHVSGNIQVGDSISVTGGSGNKLIFSKNSNNTDNAQIYKVNTGPDLSILRFELGDNYGNGAGEDYFDFCALNSIATPALRIVTTSNNIGINVPTPTSRLHVIASDDFAVARTATYAGTFLSNISTSTTANIVKKGLEVTSTGVWSGASATNIGIHVSSVTGGTSNYDAIFNGGGFVGIGTNNPTRGKITMTSSNPTGGVDDDLALTSHGDNAQPGLIFYRSRGTETAPTNVIAGDKLFNIDSYTYASGGYSNTSSIYATKKGGSTDLLSDITFRTTSQACAAFNENGRFGIGYISTIAAVDAQSLLHLYEQGLGSIGSATTGTIRLEHVTAGGSNSILFKSRVDGTDFGSISFSDDGSGNGSTAENSLLTISVGNDGAGANQDDIALMPSGFVGINCTAPKHQLHVNGNVGVVGTIFATVASVSAGVLACSDIRYKKDVSQLNNSLLNILKLNGVTYNWKVNEFPNKHFTNDKQIGFIAQELEKVYPEVVNTDNEGYKSVDYSKLTPILVEALKEQQKIIDSQANINNQQNALIDKLTSDSKSTMALVDELNTKLRKMEVYFTAETKK